MLIDFKFKNFLSYYNDATLSLLKVKSFRELAKDNVIKLDNSEFSLLKSAVVYGSNGGGKSNLIRAFDFMRGRILNSFAESLQDSKERSIFKTDFFFKLSTLSITESSDFEISILLNNQSFRYGFSIKGQEITSEYLYRTKVDKSKIGKETKIFTREGQVFISNKAIFPDGDKFKTSVNKNVLFLSYLAQNNVELASSITDYFKKTIVITEDKNSLFDFYTPTLLDFEPQFQEWINIALRFLNITRVQRKEDNSSLGIITYHNVFDSNKIVTKEISFDLTDESRGTQRLVGLLGVIYLALKRGTTIFFDEIDSSLHPSLLKQLLVFFHTLNFNNAQFIVTVHDAILLDKKLLRRDQIWFVDKDFYGNSSLYSMSDFGTSVVKNTSDFRAKYLENIFSTPKKMELSDQLINILKP